jgi:hypothetical protein
MLFIIMVCLTVGSPFTKLEDGNGGEPKSMESGSFLAVETLYSSSHSDTKLVNFGINSNQ